MEGPRLFSTVHDAWRPAVIEVAATVGAPLLSTAIVSLLAPSFRLADLVMVYLLGVVVVSTRVRLRFAVVATLLSVLSFDYLFVPPYLGFAVFDPKHLVTLGVMLFVAVTTNGLVTRLQRQTKSAEEREQRTAVLYAMSHDLAAGGNADEIATIARVHVEHTFGGRAMVLRPGNDGKLALVGGPNDPGVGDADKIELTAAQAAFDANEPVSSRSGPHPARGVYVPMRASGRVLGVLGFIASAPPVDRELRKLLETFAALTATALERADLGESAQQARVQVEAEQLKSALLGSVSHDLRTPLGVITGAASTLIQTGSVREGEAVALASTIVEEAEHLNRLVSNVLDMTRLETGTIRLRKEWQPIDEVVGAALSRVESRLQDRPVKTEVSDDLSLVFLDSVLIAQVLINLLENAIKYTPGCTPITVTATREGSEVVFGVYDEGPGVPPGEEERIFEKFYAAKRGNAKQGVGLGLAICRAIVRAHGGRIWAESGTVGARFRFTLPVEDSGPCFDMTHDPLDRPTD